jgi:hypothetical protein
MFYFASNDVGIYFVFKGLGLGLWHMQSVPIATKVVSSNPAHGEVYLIPYYVIKFVSGLRQVGGFLRVLRLPPHI